MENGKNVVVEIEYILYATLQYSITPILHAYTPTLQYSNTPILQWVSD